MLREGDELVIAAGAGHVHDRRCSAAAAGGVDGGPGAGRRPLATHRRRGPRAADPARAARARPCLDRAPGPARVPRPEPRRARGLRPPRRRRRLHARRRAAAGGLRRAGGDGGGHGQVGRGRPPAPLAGGGRGRAPPLGARAARRDAAGARRRCEVLLSSAARLDDAGRHARGHARRDPAADRRHRVAALRSSPSCARRPSISSDWRPRSRRWRSARERATTSRSAPTSSSPRTVAWRPSSRRPSIAWSRSR